MKTTRDEAEEDKKYAYSLAHQKVLYKIRSKSLDEEIFKVDDIIERTRPTSSSASDDSEGSDNEDEKENKDATLFNSLSPLERG